jgi:hypothetical protein
LQVLQEKQDTVTPKVCKANFTCHLLVVSTWTKPGWIPPDFAQFTYRPWWSNKAHYCICFKGLFKSHDSIMSLTFCSSLQMSNYCMQSLKSFSGIYRFKNQQRMIGKSQLVLSGS